MLSEGLKRTNGVTVRKGNGHVCCFNSQNLFSSFDVQGHRKDRCLAGLQIYNINTFKFV